MHDDHPQRNATVPAGIAFGVSSATPLDEGPMARRVTVRIERRPELVDRHGALATGVLGLAVDHALGGAIGQVITPDEVMITSHMHMELVRPLRADTAGVHAFGEVVHIGGGSAFTRGTIEDGDGDILALISARFAMLPVGAAAGSAIRTARDAGGPADAPADVPDALDPINAFLGMRVVDAAAEVSTIQLRAAHHLANERLGVHGGVGVLIGERTIDLAVRAAIANADDFRPVEIRTVFLRPIAADGADLTCTAAVTHAGRSVLGTTATLFTAAGKPAVTVDALHAVRR